MISAKNGIIDLNKKNNNGLIKKTEINNLNFDQISNESRSIER